MKKSLRILALLLCILLLASCGSKEPAENADAANESTAATEQPENNTEEPVDDITAFFNRYVESDERPIAVMIDNDDKNARPQAGIDEAYLVYEIVVEGGATRFMALFKGADTEKIGPVRSSRHYFLDYVLENDAIYTHFGWSPKAQSDIPALGVDNINGVLGSDGGAFWREQKYKGDWHSAFTSIEKIKNMVAQKGYFEGTSNRNGIQYSKEYINLSSENTANEISLPYSSYVTGYAYNAEKGVYEKSINGAPHTVQTGNVIEFKNIIIQLISDVSLGDGTARRNINTTGSGKGYYVTNGCYEEITWSKDSRYGDTIYKKADGTELLINPGKTIVNIINPSAAISFK